MKVAIVGAGPAGIAAAEVLVAHRVAVTLIDEGREAGGQIYRRPRSGLRLDLDALLGAEAENYRDFHARVDWLRDRIDYRPQIRLERQIYSGMRIAADAVKSASHPHHFMAVTKQGHSAIAATSGNADCHVILRGGLTPNYDAASVDAAAAELTRNGVAPRLMIDASHANSGKKAENQPLVVADIARQIGGGERRIIGVMIESHLVEGRQDLETGKALRFGQSITDGCLGWDDSRAVLEALAEAVRRRRAGVPA